MSATREQFLIDTSVWIRVYRRRPDPILEERVSGLLSHRLVLSNPVILSEMLVGCKTEDEYEGIQTDFKGLIDLAVDDGAWRLASWLGFSLRRSGIIVSLPDLIIAASAIEHDAVLMHADADFDRIAAHSSLRVESYAGTGI